MNGDFDLYVLNGKIKELRKSNERQENGLGQIEENISMIGEKMENLSVDVDLSSLNSTIGTGSFASLDKIIKDGTSSVSALISALNGKISTVSGGVRKFTADGTFTVPANVTKIWITACAGGGYGERYKGGDGGDWLFREPYSVTPGQKLTITVGKGGIRVGDIGGSTVISPLVTLTCPGQRGGIGGDSNAYESPFGINGTDGYAGGGHGTTTKSGEGFLANRYGGGGSLGRGGGYKGGTNIDPGYGGGGSSGNGSDGVVIIEW